MSGYMALLKMSDTYSAERLEAACIKALRYTPRPAYKTIQTILKSGQDQISDAPAPAPGPFRIRLHQGSRVLQEGGK